MLKIIKRSSFTSIRPIKDLKVEQWNDAQWQDQLSSSLMLINFWYWQTANYWHSCFLLCGVFGHFESVNIFFPHLSYQKLKAEAPRSYSIESFLFSMKWTQE